MALLGNIDTIQELSNILIADKGLSVKVGACLRNGIDISSRHNELILDGRLVKGDADREFYGAVFLLTQKVSNDDLVLFLRNRDGEVGINEAHLVLEALGDTDAHVLDVRDDCSDLGRREGKKKEKKEKKKVVREELVILRTN